MKKTALIAFSLALSLSARVGWGQGRLPSPSFPPRLTATIKNFEYRPFEDNAGGFYLVWVHTASTESAAVPSLFAQRVDSKGNMLWPHPVVLTRSVDTSDGWSAFPDGDGGGVVTWVHKGDLFVRRLGPDGKLDWSDELAISISTGAIQNPSGVADASGGAYVVWSQELYPRRSVLLMQHLNAAGTALWKAADMRVSLRSSDQRRPSITTDGQGGTFVAWNDSRNESSQVQAQRMDSIGDRLLAPEGILITAPASVEAGAPILEPSFNQGQAVFGWVGSQGAVDRVFLQRMDGQGHFMWAPQGIGASIGSTQQWNPVLSAADDGTLWVGWLARGSQDHWRAILTHLDGSGAPLLRTRFRPVVDVDADQGDLAITDDGKRGVVAAWYDNRTGESGLYYQDIDATGQSKILGDGKRLINGLHDPLTPELVPVSPGKTAVIWVNHAQKDVWGLYWAVVDNRPL